MITGIYRKKGLRSNAGVHNERGSEQILRGGAIGLLAGTNLGSELIRKCIHMSIALVPIIVTLTSVWFGAALLMVATLYYTQIELLRIRRKRTCAITLVTQIASRQGDMERFVGGPVTLACGAMLALMLYPQEIAFPVIYITAFADSAASIVGKFVGRIHLFNTKKTLEGSLAFFVTVFLILYLSFSQVLLAGGIALIATFIELLSKKDMDNLMLPIGVGLLLMPAIGLL